MDNVIDITPVSKTIQLPAIKDLDACIERVNHHIRKSAENVYKLGGELKTIRDKNLWEARINEKTNLPKYRGYWEFCAVEIKISESYIRRLITIHENFTLKQVKSYGVAKLSVSMTLPKPKRKKFLKAVKHVPACSPEIKEIVQTMRLEEGQERAHVIPDNVVTIPVTLGLKILPMFNGKPHGDGIKPVPARDLSDNPYANTKLSSKVTMGIRFTRNEIGDLIALVDIREQDVGVNDDRR